MYKLYITIVILTLLGIIEYRKYKHILAATVIYPVMWILSFAGIIIKGKDYYEITWVIPVIVILGYILFITGFGLMYSREALKGNHQKSEMEYIGNQMLGLNIVMVIASFIFLMILYYMLKVIDMQNILESLYKIKRMIDAGEKPFPYIVVVSRYFFRCAIWYFSLVYFKMPKYDDYKDENGKNIKTSVLIKLIIISCMAFVVMFTDISRNDILMTVVPVLFIALLSKKLSNLKSILVITGCFVFFLIFFVVFKYFRGGTIELFKEKGVEAGEDSLFHYLTSGTPALDQLYRKKEITLITVNGGLGRYTFSLPLALSDMILGTSLKPEVLQEDIKTGPKEHTNIYTYYQWLGKDFGLLYAVFFQLIFGLLYGFLYSRHIKGGYLETMIYSIAFYPLLVMFFVDQYLSIGQTWLIIICFMFLIRFVCNNTNLKTVKMRI